MNVIIFLQAQRLFYLLATVSHVNHHVWSRNISHNLTTCFVYSSQTLPQQQVIPYLHLFFSLQNCWAYISCKASYYSSSFSILLILNYSIFLKLMFTKNISRSQVTDLIVTATTLTQKSKTWFLHNTQKHKVYKNMAVVRNKYFNNK